MNSPRKLSKYASMLTVIQNSHKFVRTTATESTRSSFGRGSIKSAITDHKPVKNGKASDFFFNTAGYISVITKRIMYISSPVSCLFKLKHLFSVKTSNCKL